MDTVDFVLKWCRICKDRDGNCCECLLEEPCSLFRTGKLSKSMAYDLIARVDLTNVFAKDQNKKHCDNCKHLEEETDLCAKCYTSCHVWLPNWEPKEDQNGK